MKANFHFHRLTILLLALFSASAVAAALVDEASLAFEKELLLIMQDRCMDCHDAEMKKGDVDFDLLLKPGALRHDIRLWDKVREQLRAGTMPPKPKPSLDPAQRDTMLRWIQHNEEAVLAMPATQPGPARSRRLNREEYGNTLRDLLGIAKRPGDGFPADGAGGEGFANSADTLMLSPLLIEKHLDAAGIAIKEVWERRELRTRLLAPVTSDNLPPDKGAELALRPFLLRAYRRPPTEDDVQALLGVFRQTWQRQPNWDEAMKTMFKAALVTPKFLFIEDAPHANAKEPRRLDSFQMASRLSYLLWSSMPDDELLKLAGEDKLQDDAVLEAQVRRMLADSKAQAFTKDFAGQWLRFSEVFNSVDPDRRHAPDFNGELRQAMYDEIFAFSDQLLRKNGRVLDFLDSDYTFLNEHLAKVYEVPGVKGKDMRQVKLPNNRRGGITSMAAILAYTSYPQRTSPVLRGKWILEQLLGTPPPPPPPNVGQLPEDKKAAKATTLRQRLEAHRNKPVCAGCHARLDPPGFALENFDVIGKWRDIDNGKPIDATGTMTGGRNFATPAEFRRLLLEDKALFVRSLCTRMLGYATGRSVEMHDQPTLLRLEKVLRDSDYRSEPLLIALVKSVPFRSRL
jgi:mono/diheme cytochrome c family protein